jgi:hypothetical protein
MCGRRGSPSAADPAKLIPIWNDTIRAQREIKERDQESAK